MLPSAIRFFIQEKICRTAPSLEPKAFECLLIGSFFEESIVTYNQINTKPLNQQPSTWMWAGGTSFQDEKSDRRRRLARLTIERAGMPKTEWIAVFNPWTKSRDDLQEDWNHAVPAGFGYFCPSKSNSPSKSVDQQKSNLSATG